MAEPTITCPNCRTEVKLTESLAAPLIADTRKRYDEQLARKEAEVAGREAAISDMQADLDRERKAMSRLWAKREEQIRGVVESTAGLYGDLQGIAGRTLQEIEGLD
jgi:hypothetical protein